MPPCIFPADTPCNSHTPPPCNFLHLQQVSALQPCPSPPSRPPMSAPDLHRFGMRLLQEAHEGTFPAEGLHGPARGPAHDPRSGTNSPQKPTPQSNMGVRVKFSPFPESDLDLPPPPFLRAVATQLFPTFCPQQ